MTEQPDRPDVVLEPLVHVRDLAGSLALFEAVLGATVRAGSPDGDWVQLTIGGARIGLLAHPPNAEQDQGAVELAFTCAAGLQELERAAADAGVDVASPVVDTGFGRQLILRTPDGLLIKLNELGAP